MSSKKEKFLFFILMAVTQGIINGIVLLVILKIFKVI